ncbi:chaplin [Streptomyces sp. TE5632]
MRQVTRKGLMTVAAATGVIAAAGGVAHADSGAQGAAVGSPGVLSGNTVQAPVHAPVNVCGNTVDVVGVLNPSVGNSCANQGGSASAGHGESVYHGDSGGHRDSGGHGGSHADGHAADSPGVLSGNQIQAPIHIPVNVCGNSVDVIGAGNAATGNDCADGDHGTPGLPGDPGTPAEPQEPGDEPSTPSAPRDETPAGPSQGNQPGPRSIAAPQAEAQLARTGSELPMGLVLPVGAGALLAGAVLYRKARAAA